MKKGISGGGRTGKGASNCGGKKLSQAEVEDENTRDGEDVVMGGDEEADLEEVESVEDEVE